MRKNNSHIYGYCVIICVAFLLWGISSCVNEHYYSEQQVSDANKILNDPYWEIDTIRTTRDNNTVITYEFIKKSETKCITKTR